MPPTLYLIRHGQGEHNVNNSSHLRDPLLTATGKDECLQLREEFPFSKDISAVLASPLQRTIQTAAWVFGPELEKRQLLFILVPGAQEISGLNCNHGWDEEHVKLQAPKLIAEAAPGFELSRLDATLVDQTWNSKAGLYAHTLSAIRKRAADLRKWLWNRPEEHIALVTHGGFLHYLMEDWADYDTVHCTGWKNCEWRKFEFTEDSNGENAHLKETGNTSSKEDRPTGLDAHLISETE
ncbi:hypothetical protein N7508_007635 [Penicillium antarcticum]|uniref:uncharacterized protein n=1 Tax=Penicillium antarcticum TaxID=416450 RepID=UPI00239CCBDD|nr:uncharacterized protein N7508_007635 [Penicillium antarcticum]KAJ5297386.1 hypothetical protein N7508_007635 [Penicillium antarcticum]